MTSVRRLSLPGRLEPVDVDLAPGQLTALVGPNGSGKTSLLHAMAGVAGSADQREVDRTMLEDAHPARRARLIGLMPASRALAWPIPVRDLLALSPAKAPSGRIEELVERLELEPFLDRPSNQLSTGERASVLLARTLAPKPKLLLLDEPTGNLDPYWALSIVDLLANEARSGTTVVAAMHDFTLVRRFDRLLLMQDGRLAKDGPPAKVMSDEAFATAFRLVAEGADWRPA